MIVLDAVTVLKGGHPALAACSLELPGGIFASLIGPSGAGKTTLLRVLAGLDDPVEGSVSVGGRLLSRPGASIPPGERGVSMVFQDLALWPHRTVEGNLLLALAGTALKARERRRRAEEALGQWGLAGLARRMPETLSGGERQRVAVARAWVADRPLLLLDEPASALDRPAREALVGEIRQAQRDRGLSVLYVTHQQDEALGLSDRIVVLMEGRVAQAGTRRDLLERPASPAVRAFLGGGPA